MYEDWLAEVQPKQFKDLIWEWNWDWEESWLPQLYSDSYSGRKVNVYRKYSHHARNFLYLASILFPQSSQHFAVYFMQWRFTLPVLYLIIRTAERPCSQ